MTAADARKTLLAFDGAIESEHMGHPDFRVDEKIFATLWPDQGRCVLRLPLQLAETLASQGRENVRVVSRQGGMGWLSLPLGETGLDEFRDLAETAWRARRARPKL